jgi:serine/threonine-protein kinase RsbT
MADEFKVPISRDDDIVIARSRARELARELGFGVVDQSRIATAVSELTRNVLRYATGGRGEATVRAVQRDGQRVGIEVLVADEGPGIADTELVLREGHTTGAGLGMGLPGTRRLMDDMEIDSELGRGTRVTIRKWRR